MTHNDLLSQAAEIHIPDTSRSGAVPEITEEPQYFQNLVVLRILTFGFRARWKRSVIFWFRFVAHPVLTMRWWSFLARFTARGFPAPHDDLLQKPLSKFLVHRMRNSERLKLLTDHFLIAAENLSRKSMMALWCGEWLEMGVVEGRTEQYACQLSLADRCGGRHEGAFAIRLVRMRDRALICTCQFAFLRQGSKGGYTFVIGGMQGPRSGKRLTVETTRDLFGLRPKEAILMVLQGLTFEGASGQYRAVSQARQPIQYRRVNRRSMMRSAADVFWAERSANFDDTYGFIVPKSAVDGIDKRSRSKMCFYTIGELFH